MADAAQQSCAACQKSAGEEAVTLMKCARCKSRLYCSTACQKQDWPTHKADCRAQNYILDVHLCPGRIVDPAVRRTLSCPASASFLELHLALQAAFGWASTHMFDFKIKDPHAPPPPELSVFQYIERLKASLGQGPPVDAGPRQNFLRITQDAAIHPMAVDSTQGGVRAHPETPELSASRVRLGKVLDQYPDAAIEYEYDFGDRWEHQIAVEGRAPATDVFVCTGGEGHGVAEDVGGAPAWQDLKAAYRARSQTQAQREKMEWFERDASNRDTRGLRDAREQLWDRDGVNFRLGRM